MTDFTNLITAIAALVAAIGSVAALLTGQHNNRKLTVVEQKQDAQHLATNSRLDELVAVTGREQHAAGKAEGMAEAAKR